MAPGLRFLGAERGPKAVHLAERRGRGLDVELTGLRQIGFPEIEVVGGEQRARVLTDRARENRCVDQREVALVEEVPDRLDHFVAHPRDRHLAPAPEPEVTVLEQEGGAVLLGRDRVVRARAQHGEVLRGQLHATRRARIGAHGARDLHRSLLRECPERRPCRLRDVFLGENHLQVPGPIAQRDERDLAGRARGHDPAAG